MWIWEIKKDQGIHLADKECTQREAKIRKLLLGSIYKRRGIIDVGKARQRALRVFIPNFVSDRLKPGGPVAQFGRAPRWHRGDPSY